MVELPRAVLLDPLLLVIKFQIHSEGYGQPMNKPIITVSLITAGLLTLAIACQQPETRKSTSKWHIAPAPSTAAGYGESPLSPAAQKQTQPAASGGYGTTPPVTSKPAEQQISTDTQEAQPDTPTWKIKPPPDAAGYGAAPQVMSEPTEQQPSTSKDEAQPPTSTWKIKPPPDAAGYGKGI